MEKWFQCVPNILLTNLNHFSSTLLQDKIAAQWLSGDTSSLCVFQEQQWACWRFSRTSQWGDSIILLQRNAKRNWRKCKTFWWLMPSSSLNWGWHWCTTKFVTSLSVRLCVCLFANLPYVIQTVVHASTTRCRRLSLNSWCTASLRLLEFVIVFTDAWKVTPRITHTHVSYMFEFYLVFNIQSSYRFLKNSTFFRWERRLNDSGQQMDWSGTAFVWHSFN